MHTTQTMILLGATVCVVACSGAGGDPCLLGIWKQVYQGTTCISHKWVSFGDNGQAKLTTGKVCTASPPAVFLTSAPWTSAYSVDGGDLVTPETSTGYGDRTSYSCESQRLVAAGRYYSGTWARLAGAEAAAVDELLRLRCSSYWSECLGAIFGDLKCVQDRDCPTGMRCLFGTCST